MKEEKKEKAKKVKKINKVKKLYESTAKRRFCDITEIKEKNLTLEMKPLKKLKENIWVPILILASVIGLLLLNFNYQTFLVCVAIVLLMIPLFIFGNKATLHCDKESLNIKQGFQSLKVPYENLKNVYLSRVSGMLFFMPAFNYNIVVRFEDNLGFLRELEFSLLCADKDEVEKFLNNFEIKGEVQNRYVNFEKRKIWKKIANIIFTIIIAIVVILYILPACGINMKP